MNQAKTLQSNPRKMQKDPILESSWNYWEESFKIADDPALPLWMNRAKTRFSWILEKIQNDPILLRYMNQAKTIRKNPVKMQMALFCGCGWIQLKPSVVRILAKSKMTVFHHYKYNPIKILPLWMHQAKKSQMTSVNYQNKCSGFLWYCNIAYKKLVLSNQAVQFLINEKKLKREAG